MGCPPGKPGLGGLAPPRAGGAVSSHGRRVASARPAPASATAAAMMLVRLTRRFYHAAVLAQSPSTVRGMASSGLDGRLRISSGQSSTMKSMTSRMETMPAGEPSLVTSGTWR